MLAALVTLANVAKPVTVDDTAYLLFARHISSHPTDPYGFTIFWWGQPESAMEVLCPPVVPYWFALGVSLFGEHIGLLKLWLFPFVLLLAWALNSLLVRFARGTETFVLPVLMLSPAVLPALNLMLDVPALALAVASLELFARAANRGLWCSALAGLVAGLAMQTKYSAFVAPVVLGWYGLTHRRVGSAVCAVCVAVALFVGWELLLVAKYGRSHFAFHADSSGAAGGGLKQFLEDKGELLAPLGGYLGCLAVGGGLLALSTLRVPRRWLAGAAVTWCVGFVLVATLPRRWTVVTPELTLVTAFWQLSGLLWFVAGLACAGVLLFRVRSGIGVRTHRESLFLAGWLLIEVAAVLGLTPFAAARRVMGLSIVLALVAAGTLSRVRRVYPERFPARWLGAVGVGAGVLVAAIDTLDAFPEKVCAEEAAARIAQARAGESLPAGQVWYAGHWGFQYYCERAGMGPLIARQTVARAGDYLVLPEYPPDDPFPRPYAGFDVHHPPAWIAEDLGGFEVDDPLSAKTVPNLYGGTDPITGRDHPRLRVRVYRLRADWVMP